MVVYATYETFDTISPAHGVKDIKEGLMIDIDTFLSMLRITVVAKTKSNYCGFNMKESQSSWPPSVFLPSSSCHNSGSYSRNPHPFYT